MEVTKSYTDRTEKNKINEIQIGKIHTLKVLVKKYSFPRVRNLPNRVVCEDKTGKIDCVFFNSYEGYIKKILPINKEVIVNGKVGLYKGKYQIINPKFLSENLNGAIQDLKKYSLTEGLTTTKYNKIIDEVLKKIPNLKEWHSKKLIEKLLVFCKDYCQKSNILKIEIEKSLKK